MHVTHLAIDELDILRALSIAIAGTVLRAGLVVGILGHTAVSVHLREVEGAVETARQGGHVDVEGKLLVLQMEKLIVGRAAGSHEVDTGADVLAVRVVGNELQSERITTGSDTVGVLIISPVERAILCTK